MTRLQQRQYRLSLLYVVTRRQLNTLLSVPNEELDMSTQEAIPCLL
jgi:hypothetical protein